MIQIPFISHSFSVICFPRFVLLFGKFHSSLPPEREVFMKHRIIAILLVLCLCTALVPASFAAEDTRTLAGSIDIDAMVSHGISLFKYLEAGGKWDSVVNTSAGCVGMGIMGWINSSALQLLKWCASSAKGGDPTYCQAVLGDDLYYEVVNAPVYVASELMPRWGYWGSRRFSAEEIARTKTLLGSEVGIRCQKNLARLYITRQAQHGWNAGVRTESALLYYCSAENHYGEGGVKSFMTAVRNALGISSSDLIRSLRQFHNGVKAAAQAGTVTTLSYRTKVYNYLVNTLGLSQDPDPSDPEPPAPDPPAPTVPFTDMPSTDHWAYDAIVWAYNHEPRITAGTTSTTFSPNDSVTRAAAMTFLWIAAGKPAPSSTQTSFADIKPGAYYYKAVLWAVEKGYTTGRSATSFAPKGNVTRAEMLTFLWAYVGKPSQSWWNIPYTDVSAQKYYYSPVAWAYHGGILVGNEGSGTNFNPDQPCTRAYVVTYLYNLFVLTAP